MRDGSKPPGIFARLADKLLSATAAEPVRQSSTTESSEGEAPRATPAAAAPQTSAAELINEGLRQRQQLGTAAAVPFFERAAAVEPNSHLPFFMLGNAATELGDLDAAVVHYARARDLAPNDYVIHYNLGLSHFWRGYMDPAIEELAAACRINPSYLPARAGYLLALHNSDRVAPRDIAAAIRDMGAQYPGAHAPSAPAAQHDSGLARKLRVGFVSGDLRTHSVAHFFEPILSARNRDAFEYICYNTKDQPDEVTERLRADADAWRDVWQLTDDALAEQIRADRIDILVDLSGHTEFNRLPLFARRAAPVQITYLGFPNSTGVPAMDYRITDGRTDPGPLADELHSERLLRLPDSQWCFRPFGAARDVGALPARENGFVTFGSFNNPSKASDTLLRCWTRILSEVPDCRLRITRLRSPQRAADIVALFARCGIAADRIEFTAFRNDVPYGLQYAGVDIALDHFPYNGVTTTCESLYFGLPVVSMYGTHGVSRSGLSILSSMALQELAAASPDEYVNIAVTLAGDLDRLERLRSGLRERLEQSPLRGAWQGVGLL
jgi:predicted O-linked N-acetylglucosamine transferase (SPINDLY family)